MDPYDKRSLLASIAALLTEGMNIGFGYRLGTLAEAVASISPVQGQPAMSRSHLRKLCNSADLLDALGGEDPPEYPFTEPVAFEGHVYRVLVAGTEEEAIRAEALFSAIDVLHARRPDTFTQGAREMIVAGLALADAIARRSPHVARQERSAHVQVPTTDATPRVTWDRLDLEDLAARMAVPVAALNPLIVPAGGGRAGATSDEGLLLARPVVEFPDGSFVVVPDALLIAISHQVLGAAKSAGRLDALAEAYADAVADLVAESLGNFLLTKAKAAPTLPTSGLPCSREIVSEAPGDVLMATLIVTDPLGEFDPADARGYWEPDDAYEAALSGRLADLAAWAVGEATPGQAVLVAVVMSLPAGRGVLFHFKPPSDPVETIALGPGSLQVISFHERGQPLALHRFAQSRRALRDRIEVLAFNVLDEYVIYDDNNKSFYNRDDSPVTLMSISPDTGRAIRETVAEEIGRTSARFRAGPPDVDLMRRYQEGASPIFVSRGRMPGDLRLIRLQGVDVWVLGPKSASIEPAGRSLYFEIIDAVAYWIWQIGPRSIEEPGWSAPPNGILTIQLQIENPGTWLAAGATAGVPDATSILTGARPADGEGVVHLAAGFAAAIAGPDNRGERWLAAELDGLLRELVGLPVRDPTDLLTILDDVAPIGQKKMFVVLPEAAAVDVGSDDNLPRWRKVPSWDSSCILDDLADHYARTGRAPGPAGDKTAQSDLINEGVEFFYQQMKAAFAVLSPEGLLEGLIAHNEALLRERALRRIQTPTRVACFGGYSDMVDIIRRETQEVTTASVANRFLLEYVAAEPPSGSLPLTDGRYDRVLALADAIINRGFQSDVIRYDLGEANVRILPSGRLGSTHGAFGHAVDATLAGATPAEIRDAQQTFDSHWRSLPSAPSAPPDGWEEAFHEEFGYLFSDLVQVSAELTNLVPAGVAALAMPRADLVRQIDASTPADVATIERVLDDLVLVERPDFATAPPGYSGADIWPWLFNRRLSFVRRPIVARGAGPDADLVWGYRAIPIAVAQVAGLITEGRLKPRSKAMGDLQARQTDAASKAFVKTIDSIVSGLGMSTRTNVIKFGALRIESTPGQDLGDVDVLGIDTRRRVLWAIECKNLVLAKTPHELASEIRGFEDPHKGMIAKHRRRLDWIEAHLPDVIRELGLPPDRWTVEGLLAVQSDMVGLHLSPMSMPVVPAEDLGSHLLRSRAGGGTAPKVLGGTRTSHSKRKSRR